MLAVEATANVDYAPSSYLLLEVGGGKKRVDVLGGLLELPLAVVPRPLEGVLDLVGEVLQGADGDGLLGGVPGGAVVLGELGDDDLGVTLGAQGAALEHGQAVEHTALVHVEAGLDVVEGGAHTVELVVEVVAEDILGLGPDAELVGGDVETRVHALGGPGARDRLGVVDVRVAE